MMKYNDTHCLKNKNTSKYLSLRVPAIKQTQNVYLKKSK